MKFSYQIQRGIPQKISTVCLEVQDILLSEDFHERLSRHGKFDQSNLDGPTLSTEIKRVLGGVLKGVEVSSYSYPWYKRFYRSRVVANVGSAAPSRINLNTYFFGVNDDLDYANTIGHETVHVVDNHSPYYFGHGDNDPSGDELTASHVVGAVVAEIYRQRRDKRLLLSARQGQGSLNETLHALGFAAKGMEEVAQMMSKTNKVGVYDYGTEPRTTEKSITHVAD